MYGYVSKVFDDINSACLEVFLVVIRYLVMDWFSGFESTELLSERSAQCTSRFMTRHVETELFLSASRTGDRKMKYLSN